ncbi:MAG: GNAT family N-acetyltransferase [Rickettsiales bacterium]|nr:GNAT family N-acetyltransferase [Rickettsiales bacterium]
MPSIRAATPDDIPALSHFAAEMFEHTFGELYSTHDLHAHLNNHYQPEHFAKLLDDETVHFSVISEDGNMLAFAQYGGLRSPVENPKQPCAELHRLYVHPDCKGRGMGKALMATVEDFFKPDIRYLYLGVYSENYSAQEFYKRFDFEKVAEAIYPVGNHKDREFIMLKELV